MPDVVLRQTQEAIRALPGTGISILGLSHRTPLFRKILDEAEQRVRDLLAVPRGYHVLFLQGGGTMQFSMVPMAMLPPGGVADYVVSGYWSRKAVEAARCHGQVRTAWDGASDGHCRLPRAQEPLGGADAAYLHHVSNETVEGLQFRWVPRSAAPLVCDMSSDFLSRPFDVRPYSLLYAHAQKNIGPAGVTIVLLRDEVLAGVPEGLPPILDYRAHVAARSILHTPPVFSIYVVLLVLRWLSEEVGGLSEMEKQTAAKARLVYGALDQAGAFYRRHALPGCASDMNVVFRTPSAELDARFCARAEQAGLVGTEGHRTLGGLRVSLYNGVTVDDARVLSDFILEFAHEHRDSAFGAPAHPPAERVEQL